MDSLARKLQLYTPRGAAGPFLPDPRRRDWTGTDRLRPSKAGGEDWRRLLSVPPGNRSLAGVGGATARAGRSEILTP